MPHWSLCHINLDYEKKPRWWDFSNRSSEYSIQKQRPSAEVRKSGKGPSAKSLVRMGRSPLWLQFEFWRQIRMSWGALANHAAWPYAAMKSGCLNLPGDFNVHCSRSAPGAQQCFSKPTDLVKCQFHFRWSGVSLSFRLRARLLVQGPHFEKQGQGSRGQATPKCNSWTIRRTTGKTF